MKSIIANAINLTTQPVALIWTNEQPEGAVQFNPQKWNCAVTLFAAAAAHGLIGAFDRGTYGCWGGGVGLGFGNQYGSFPGGMDCYYRFLSTGNMNFEKGQPVAEQLKESGFNRMADDFSRGKRYLDSPEAANSYVMGLPICEIPCRFVVVKPLDQVDQEKDQIKNVTFFVDPDGLSALVNLANYKNPADENVTIPWVAGCQAMGICAYRELEREHPRAIIGMMDITARQHVRATLGENVLSFTMPWALFQSMEESVEGSFLQESAWLALQDSKE
jgi:hypothetical protein